MYALTGSGWRRAKYPSTRMDDGERFLRTLHYGLPGFTEIRPRPGLVRAYANAVRRWIPTDRPDHAWLWTLGASNMGLNVYFGVLPRAVAQSGTVVLSTLSGVYVDVDAPADEVLRRDPVRSLPWSAVVISGFGVHLHARFSTPLDPVQDRERWSNLEHGLIELVGGDAAVCDAARILRVPGSRSWKRGGAPVALVDLSDRRSPVEAWEEAVGSRPLARVLPFAPAPVALASVESRYPSGGAPAVTAWEQPSFRWLSDNVPVSRVVRHYGLADAAGGLWRGPCFLHGGDNPTGFTIAADDQRWMCWTRGCGQPGGSVVDLAMILEDGDARAATRMLHALAGGPRAGRTIWKVPGG
mgnify:CR=1 FL=1